MIPAFVVFLYLAIVLYIGIFAFRRSKGGGAEDFFLANRSLGTFVFLLSLFVPVIGPLIHAWIGGILSALFLAIDYVDWAASRHALGVRERLGFAVRRPGAMLGLGAGIWAMLLVPFVNLLFMPAAVAGATLMFLDIRRANGSSGEPS